MFQVLRHLFVNVIKQKFPTVQAVTERDFSGDLDSEDVASGLKVIKICRMVST
uniref:Uncharacterized protein n=1 Tax=Moniliophthora roreri TaxID=221103 RepID=A0A0W0G9V1_MONRR